MFDGPPNAQQGQDASNENRLAKEGSSTHSHSLLESVMPDLQISHQATKADNTAKAAQFLVMNDIFPGKQTPEHHATQDWSTITTVGETKAERGDKSSTNKASEGPAISGISCDIPVPAGWQGERLAATGGAIGDIPVQTFFAPGTGDAKLSYWDRTAKRISDVTADAFQDLLKIAPGIELKGNRNESAIAAILGNGVLDNVGNFDTLSMQTRDINGQRVLMLEAKWPSASPPLRSIGLFIDGAGTGKSVEQVWFIAPTDGSFNNGNYGKFRDEAVKAFDGIHWKK